MEWYFCAEEAISTRLKIFLRSKKECVHAKKDRTPAQHRGSNSSSGSEIWTQSGNIFRERMKNSSRVRLYVKIASMCADHLHTWSMSDGMHHRQYRLKQPGCGIWRSTIIAKYKKKSAFGRIQALYMQLGSICGQLLSNFPVLWPENWTDECTPGKKTSSLEPECRAGDKVISSALKMGLK